MYSVYLCTTHFQTRTNMKKINVRLEKAIEMVRQKYFASVNNYRVHNTEINHEKATTLQQVLEELEAIRDAE